VPLGGPWWEIIGVGFLFGIGFTIAERIVSALISLIATRRV
jgi:high-affinity nickel permease